MIVQLATQLYDFCFFFSFVNHVDTFELVLSQETPQSEISDHHCHQCSYLQNEREVEVAVEQLWSHLKLRCKWCLVSRRADVAGEIIIKTSCILQWIHFVERQSELHIKIENDDPTELHN